LRRGPPAGGAGTLTGIALSIVGAAGFASKGVITKFLYADGWGAEAVLTTRAFFALPIIAAWALWATGPRALLRPPPRAVLGAAAAGCLCYYLGALLDFRALTMIDASVERVLLFSYPSMVVVLYAAIYREWPDLRVLGALIITYAGIFMVVTGLDAGVLRGNVAGAGLVLACALTSALYYLASDRWTASIGSVAFTFYALAAATVCLGLHRLIAGGATATVWHARDLWLLLALVVVATVVPMLAMAEGVRRLGAPRASVVATVGPPTTIVLGAWLLDERLRSAQWIGVALIVAGILALELSKRPAAAASQAG
jgi:drug/metabolite transporter (DMT)-like permease